VRLVESHALQFDTSTWKMGDIHLPGAAREKGVYRRRKSSIPVEIVRTMPGKGQEAD
jgi:hypothetical protein